MTLVWDPMYIVNLVLCIIILVLALWGYSKSGKNLELYIGIAFALFGVSHLGNILGYKDTLNVSLIVVRTLAYLLVIYALYNAAVKKK